MSWPFFPRQIFSCGPKLRLAKVGDVYDKNIEGSRQSYAAESYVTELWKRYLHDKP